MSRSFKKAIITISKKLPFNVHRAARHQIKTKLNKINPDDVDGLTLLEIEADVREMGLEEWGTKLGMEFESLKEGSDIISKEEQEEELKKERRK